MNATFSIELYIKALAEKHGAKLHGHELLKLHRGLPKAALKEIELAIPICAPKRALAEAPDVLRYLVLSIVIGHTAAKRAQRQVQHELRKYELALVHGDFCGFPPKTPKSDFRRSNRDQTETLNSASKSLTYDASM